VTPVRVLQSVNSWLPLTQRWSWVQVSFLPPRIESTVVTSRLENAEQFPWPDVRLARFAGLAAHRFPRPLRRAVRSGFLRRTAHRTRAALVHSHFGSQGWEDRSAVIASGIGHVVTFYGYDVVRLPRTHPVWRRRYRELFTSVDRVLCEGEFMARSVASLGCPEAKLRVHRLGVETERIPFTPRRLDEGKPLRILMAAAFVEKKGIPDGVRAVARLARSRPIELTLVGDADVRRDAQDEKRRILDAIAAEGIGREVRLLGFQSHAVLAREMAQHHVFLQPSRHAADGDSEGGAPVSLIEAVASGMAVVSTTHCDIPGVVIHGTTGWLAPERDVEALERGLRWWTEQPDWERILIAGRRRIEAEFDAARQAQRLAAIYDEIANRSVDAATAGAERG
jgi:colanic acid/amylovoran biosynthesis glycosyltransferase